MPKQRRHASRNVAVTHEELVRHHIEEAIVHLASIPTLNQGEQDALNAIRRNLKKIWLRHGGIDH